jgi:hypothetical protein
VRKEALLRLPFARERKARCLLSYISNIDISNMSVNKGKAIASSSGASSNSFTTIAKNDFHLECAICPTHFKTVASGHLQNTGKCDHQVCLGCIHQYFNGTLKSLRYTSYDYIECPSSDCN